MKISTLKLSALLALMFSASVSMAQTTTYNTIGVIGKNFIAFKGQGVHCACRVRPGA